MILNKQMEFKAITAKSMMNRLLLFRESKMLRKLQMINFDDYTN